MLNGDVEISPALDAAERLVTVDLAEARALHSASSFDATAELERVGYVAGISEAIV